ncbi:MAG: hypothetical protein OQK29_01305 [Ignavibacteriaceae bacterium]|nr:hypothetical protein [Ignavibacteriaceae bacterium]
MTLSPNTLPSHSYDKGIDFDSEPESWTETHTDSWCGMAITVTAIVNGKGGTVKSIEIELDNSELYNAFNGHYELTLNEYVERVTTWEVPNDVEIC